MMNTNLLEEQLEVWKEEQYSIASQVIRLPDDDDDDGTTKNMNDRFKVLKSSKVLCNNNNNNNNNNNIYYYGGVDVSFPENENDQAVATYVIIELSLLSENDNTTKTMTKTKVIYKDYIYFDLKIPYVSSFLSFREIEPYELLIKKQRTEQPQYTPSIIFVDGNGILHQRRAGIACFVGVRTGIPTIGIGKSLYCEGGLNKDIVQKEGIDRIFYELEQYYTSLENHHHHHQQQDDDDYVLMNKISIKPNDNDDEEKESTINNNDIIIDRKKILNDILDTNIIGIGVKLQVSSVEDNNNNKNILGCALVGHGVSGNNKNAKNKKKKVGTKNPIYISIGHNISLQSAVVLTAKLCIESRIPEPIRHADLWGRELLRNKNKANKSKTN